MSGTPETDRFWAAALEHVEDAAEQLHHAWSNLYDGEVVLVRATEGSGQTDAVRAIGLLMAARSNLDETRLTTGALIMTLRQEVAGPAAAGDSDVTRQPQTGDSRQTPSKPHIETRDRPRERLRQLKNMYRLIMSGTPAQEIPGYVGEGGVTYVYDDAGGDAAVIKVPKVTFLPGWSRPELQKELERDYVEPMERTKGDERFEQIRGRVDYTARHIGCVSVGKVMGPDLHKMPGGDLDDVPLDHYRALADAYDAAVQKDLWLDQINLNPRARTSNVMYQPSQGFVFIDYKPVKYDRDRREAPVQAQDFLWQFHRYFTAVESGLPVAAQKYLQAYAERYGAAAGGLFRDYFQKYVDGLRAKAVR